MPNPPRKTIPGVARYVTPSRGANIVLLTFTPRSIGTDPTPPIIIWLVLTSYRSRPRLARVGMGKYSQRVPYEIVILDVCHWSRTYRLYCQLRVVYGSTRLSRPIWSGRPSRNRANALYWLPVGHPRLS